MGEVAEADRMAHLIGSSVYDVAAQLSAIVFLAEDKTEVSTDSVQASACTGGPI